MLEHSQRPVLQQYGVHWTTISCLIGLRRATGILGNRLRRGHLRVMLYNVKIEAYVFRQVVGTHGRPKCP